MVVTPEEAGRITEDEKSKIVSLEKEIDKAIIEGFSRCRSNDLCLDASIFGGYGTRVFEELKRKYEEAGWTIRYQSDQRDGDYLRLSPRKDDRNIGCRNLYTVGGNY